MPTQEEINASLQAAATAAEEAKAKEAEEAAKAGITTDAGKEALRKEREARRASEKAAKEAADELATLKAEKAAADEAKAKADQAEALKRGDHEKVIESTTAENATLKAELETLRAEKAARDAEAKAEIEAAITANQIDARDLAHDPGPEAPLDARKKWFKTALANSAGESRTGFQRTPVAPRPITLTRDQAVEDEKKRLRADPNYQRF